MKKQSHLKRSNVEKLTGMIMLNKNLIFKSLILNLKKKLCIDLLLKILIISQHQQEIIKNILVLKNLKEKRKRCII